MLSSKLYFDVSLLNADIFAENNYIYLSKSEYKFSRFFQSNPNFPTHGEKDEDVAYDKYNKDSKNAYGSIRVGGPSFMMVYGRHAFSFQTSMRTAFSVHNLPYDVAKFVFTELDYTPQFNIHYNDNKKFGCAAMSWGETGISYAYSIYQRRLDQISAGITVKKLFGYAGGYISGKNVDYMVPNSDTILIYNLNANGGFAIPVDYDKNEYPGPGSFFRGSGWGFDIGFTYERKRKEISNRPFYKMCEQKYQGYVYRIGVSLLDVGGIKFKDNARKFSFNNVSYNWYEVSDLNYIDIDSTLIDFSNRFYGNSTELVTGNTFTIYLPTALSMQFDYSYNKNLYLNSTLICGFQLNEASVHRASQLSLTPRYESRLLEASLPLSLYEFNKLRIGAAIRLGFLTIGSDKLGGFFKFSDFEGMDFYFALKFNFSKGSCRGGGFTGCENYEFLKFRKKNRYRY